MAGRVRSLPDNAALVGGSFFYRFFIYIWNHDIKARNAHEIKPTMNIFMHPSLGGWHGSGP